MNYPNKLSFINIQVLLLISYMLLSACEPIGGDMKYRSIGAPGEILVVMDNKLQKSQVQEIIQAFADTEFPNLPQPESTFRLTTLSPNDFEGHFKAYRNIVIVQQKIMAKADVKFQNNTWASHQQVVEITIPNTNSFTDLFKTHQKRIFDFIYNGDIRSVQHANLKSVDAAIQGFIKQKYGLDCIIPQGYRLVKDTANFCWLRFDRLETAMHLVIQSFDMDSLPTIHNNELLALLDSVGKEFIPGPSALTFKQTEKELPVLFNEIKVNQQDVIELRGLWKVEGFFMGGPFVTFFIKDETRNRLLMIDGFVHAPQKQNKAYYVRQLEAILHSVKIL